MAKNWQFPSNGKAAEPIDWSGPGSYVLDAAGTDAVHVPDGGWILSAEFVRQGPDLLLVGKDGSKVLIKSFFKFADPPDLITPDGAVINGPLAVKLAGPAAPGVEAQAGPAAATEPIGKIVTVAGKVDATRADGTKVELKVGDPVYQGDVIETGPLGAVGMEFADESTFSLADSGRMVLDEMVYDPAAQSGTFGASIVQGAFSFISGQIAKTGPDNMLINTPTATIGIRGTALAGKAAPEGEQSNFTILPEGNFVGEVVISNNAGTVVLNQAGSTVSIASINLAPPPPIVITAQQIQQQYGNVLRHLPPLAVRRRGKSRAGPARFERNRPRTGPLRSPGRQDGADGRSHCNRHSAATGTSHRARQFRKDRRPVRQPAARRGCEAAAGNDPANLPIRRHYFQFRDLRFHQ
ncbi:MAG: hypothetical protein RLP27_01890 [Rhodospirillales bacterium]